MKSAIAQLTALLVFVLISACSSSNNPTSESSDLLKDPNNGEDLNAQQTNNQNSDCSPIPLSTKKLISLLGLVDADCDRRVIMDILDLVHSSQASPSDTALLLIEELNTGATNSVQPKVNTLNQILDNFWDMFEHESRIQLLEAINDFLVESSNTNIEPASQLLGVLETSLFELCQFRTSTLDCLDAASAVFLSPLTDSNLMAQATGFYQSILDGRPALDDEQIQKLAELVSSGMSDYSVRGTKIAASLFDRALDSSSTNPNFLLPDNQLSLLVDALILAYAGRDIDTETVIQAIRISDTLDRAFTLSVVQDRQLTLFAALETPIDTLKNDTRVSVEKLYFSIPEECPYTLPSQNLVAPTLYLPKNAENQDAIRYLRSCEIYRATNEFFLATVGDAYQSRSSDLPDTGAAIYYFDDELLFETYLEVNLSVAHFGGLYQSEYYFGDANRFNSIYIRNSVADAHVIAHEYAHYLFARHVRSRYSETNINIQVMFNEGFAEYVSNHALAESDPLEDVKHLICDYSKPYMTLESLLDGNSYGLDYDLAYIYLYFLINSERQTFDLLLQAFKNGTPVYLSGSQLVIGENLVDVETLDSSLHSLFDSTLFCG